MINYQIRVVVHCDSLVRVGLLNPDGGALCFAREDGGGCYCIFRVRHFFLPLRVIFLRPAFPPRPSTFPLFPIFFPANIAVTRFPQSRLLWGEQFFFPFAHFLPQGCLIRCCFYSHCLKGVPYAYFFSNFQIFAFQFFAEKGNGWILLDLCYERERIFLLDLIYRKSLKRISMFYVIEFYWNIMIYWCFSCFLLGFLSKFLVYFCPMFILLAEILLKVVTRANFEMSEQRWPVFDR